MENIKFETVGQLLAALGSIAALGGLFKIRADNAKSKAETGRIEEEINDKIFARMERINAQLEEALIQAIEKIGTIEAENKELRAALALETARANTAEKDLAELLG